MTNFEIRTTTEADVPVILDLIRELAEYERAPDEVVTNEAELREVLFGAQRSAEVLLALEEGQPVGFAVYFFSFSTWLAGRGFIWKIFLFGLPHAGKVMAGPCWNVWRGSRMNAVAGGWNGRCSIGTSRRSSFIRSSARNRNRNGRFFG